MSASAVVITNHLHEMDFQTIHEFIRNSYWARNIPVSTLQKALQNSLCFAALDAQQNTIGFARMVTDKATFGYLSDVFVLPEWRGRGVSREILEAVVAHPDLQGLRRFMLATKDAHGLYTKYGFSPVEDASPLMQIWQPDIYQQ
ncbi:GNAT family N-acetyltransferase [Alteromonas alba]|uniref:GNAT family N-acetyltransferase n=1 Tax=Alteromonas alba TaxID=2079529 RepID=A0A2S9V713_9ALTE|nr:GNAT family N-acetyltransferase [Alteromonas alba]MAJ69153.1 GNAT family N-acetyltransferase [Alteromonadaceae bacterium]PRO72145.1 GNAT family N-acetyltransferase [Alteromonas alba]|tara:strand:+ start:2069 stop:2500 length:432 start_codon:yes stop_codon:yes gene_type:complete